MASDRSHWRAGTKAWKLGSVALEQRLRESLKVLEKLGARVPNAGRHQRALTTLAKWNDAADSIDLRDEPEVARIESAHRIGWETYLIAVAAMKAGRKRSRLFPVSDLNTMLGGALIERGRTTAARDLQFELYITAVLFLCSLDVRRGEPDILVKYGYETLGIASKRVTSLKPKQLKKHIKKAAFQIRESGKRGWVALNLDSRFHHVSLDEDDEEAFQRFNEVFDPVSSVMDEYRSNPMVLGYILFGYVAHWWPEPTPEGPMRLHSATPLRWMVWTEEAGGEILFRDFIDGWRARFDQRIALLASPDFEGRI